jgi:hypothetical protein
VRNRRLTANAGENIGMKKNLEREGRRKYRRSTMKKIFNLLANL